MPAQPPYAIPEESSARSAAQLYERYRLRLDEELSRQRHEKIIDVKPSRVSLEGGTKSSGAQAKIETKAEAKQTSVPARTGAQAGKGGGTSSRARRTSNIPPENAFVYEPSPNNEEVTLKLPPKARGIFIDFQA